MNKSVDKTTRALRCIQTRTRNPNEETDPPQSNLARTHTYGLALTMHSTVALQ
jgi:hypothetical protein